MAQLYGPPSDGSVIPHELEDAIAADLTDTSRPIGRSAAGKFSSRYATAATQAATAPLMSKLTRSVLDATILAIGDSTGNEPGEHFYLTLQDLAARYPAYTVNYRLWNMTTDDYDPVVTVQTGTSSRVLSFYNCSAPGKTPAYVMGARWAKAVAAVPAPDLVFISHSHNMGDPNTSPSGERTNRWDLMQLTEELAVQHPKAGIVLESQNPTTTAGRETWQAIKAQIIQDLAAQRGYGFIDAHQAFVDYAAENGVTLDSLMLDKIHPTAEGSQIWSAVEVAALTFDAGASAPARQISSLLQTGPSLIPDPFFKSWTDVATPPPGWVANNAIIEKDTVNFETGTYGVKITNGATTTGYAGMVLESQNSFGNQGKIAGRMVTAAVRVFVPATYTGLPSLILRDNTGASKQSRIDVAADARGRFVWLVASRQMSPTGQFLRVELVSRVSGSGEGSITVDRVMVTEGDLPREALPTG